MPPTHTADFQTAALKATDLDAVEKVNVGLETELVKKHVNIIADAPEIRIQDKTGSAPEVNATTMAIVADGGTTHFRAGTTTFAEGSETKGDIKFQSSTGATTHAEIVGSSGTLELQDGGLGLKLGSNVSVSGTPSAVIQEITGPHARESAVLKKFPEVPLASNVQSGYVIEASSDHSSGNYPGWNAFNGVVETTNGADGEWISGAGKYNTSATNGAYLAHSSNAVLFQGARGEYLGIVLPHRIKVKYVSVYGRPDSGSPRTVREYRLWGSNDGSTWNQLQTGTNTLAVPASTNKFNITVDATTAYSRYRLQALSMNTGEGGVSIGELEYYGYEEVGAADDSVDTTVKSVYNAPDLTNAALYIDGKKSGSTPTDYGGSSVTVTNNGTWNSSDNTWSLSGTTTSNIVSGDLTSLVGDHPHSISAWVKADQLNGDGLFHVGTAEGEGDAASRVGFVDDSHITWGGEDHFFSNSEWHNVTYVYNGEGSDKKLYLDGRRVGTAKNEDTFGDYPPFTMTTYSQFGYTVSASGINSNYPPYYVFDDQTTFPKVWISPGNLYTTSSTGGISNGGAITEVDGVNKGGEWIQIEFPFKLNVDYVAIKPPRSADADRAPQDGFIVGSTDGITWTSLLEWTGITTWGTNETVAKNLVMTKNGFYKYFRLIVTRLQPNNTNQQAHITELQFYGHKENDLVRFPDPTNVLKYPHINFTGHGNASTTGYHATVRRGYVVSASTKYAATSASDAWRAFDGVVDLTSGSGGQSWDSKANTYAGPYNGALTGRASVGAPSATTFNSRDGEWINVKFPRKVLLTSYQHWTRMDRDHEGPYSGYLYGSNDGFSTFQEIHRFAAITLPTTSGGVKYLHTVSSSYTPSGGSAVTLIPYNEYRLQVTHTQASTYLNIALLEFYGTEHEDVVARVGDGFDGKVRNVRVYSTALSDARVQEIFDADKDEFGLAKSSVSVYRGHLGVGTDTPEAALTVMDEVAELEEFPPRDMTAAETYIEGHGVFKASFSYQSGAYGAFHDYSMFNSVTTNGFHSANDYSANSPYEWNGAATGIDFVTQGEIGAWVQLILPYKIKLSKFTIWPRSNLAQGTNLNERLPGKGVLFGWNDTSETWVRVYDLDISANSALGFYPAHEPIWFYANATSSYSAFRFVITHLKGAADGTGELTCNFSRMQFFGTREQGASTLHNGELSLTRNLTVPRIGPPLDADDTPRRDRLVVEYNTSVNPTENGVVKDTSGHGWDANFYGSSAYDASEKAITLSDGTDDYLETGKIINGYSGDIDHTFALWVKPSKLDMVSGNHYLAVLGSETAQNKWCAISISAKHLSHIVHSSIEIASDTELVPETWQHIAISYTSGGSIHSNVHMDYYINGEKYTGSFTSGGSNYGSTSYTIDLVGPLSVRIGSLHNGSEDAASSISNFKLYDVALTADEVRRLYDMGRCDEGHHTTVVSRSKLQMRGEQLILEPCIKGFYEEGTWTPLIGGHTSGRKTPGSSNYGWFIRVGNLVTIGGTVAWSGGDSLVGHIVIDGIPYPATSTGNARSALSVGVVGGNGITTSSGYDTLRLVLDPGYSYIWFIQTNEEGSTTVTYNHSPGVGSSGQIYGIGGSYMI